jgi:mycolipenoyl-CoA---2-(long-chain-fatty acyl)-trehalose mycolipenoyltransferase / long-chain-acyl-CoA---trehalose acyltransferase
MPATPGMFALSWLDTRRLPVAVPDPAAQWVSAVIRTDGVMIWFVLNDAGLHLRCRYPDTPEARASLALWLAAVESELRAAAPASEARRTTTVCS